MAGLKTAFAAMSAKPLVATSIPDQINLIRNPPHHASYSPPYPRSATNNSARLIVIGDVHGMLTELKSLLKQAKFTPSCGDRVIFAGDLVNKGPDSADMVQLAMDIDATSVRGNHEDKVLRVWAAAEGARLNAETAGKNGDDAYSTFTKGLGDRKKGAFEVARSLTAEQRIWLAKAPVALRLGRFPGLGEVAVVHAGMVPGIDFDKQEPWAMLNIRALIDLVTPEEATKDDEVLVTSKKRFTDTYPGLEPSKAQLQDAQQSSTDDYKRVGYLPTSEFNDGTWWVDSWNTHQKAKSQNDRLTLIYGHDAKRGVQIKEYSFGLDSGCVNGGSLTALVLQPDERTGVLEHHLVSVPGHRED